MSFTYSNVFNFHYQAIRVCMQDNTATADNNPLDRRQCYFDYMVTNSAAVATDTSTSVTKNAELASVLSMHCGIQFAKIPIMTI